MSDKEDTLGQVRVGLIVATSKLERLRVSAENLEEEVLMARSDVSLQTTSREEVQEQLDERVAVVKKVRL